MSKLERYTVTMPGDLFAAFDERNKRMGYRNRSEAVRDLVRAALVEDQWKAPDEVVAATMTLVYDHHQRGLTERLTELQHASGDHVISTMHVHLDRHNCLEVIVMRGTVKEIEKIADNLRTARGVKHAGLVLTADGETLC